MAKIQVLKRNVLYRRKDYKAGTPIADLPAEMQKLIGSRYTTQVEGPTPEPEPTSVAKPAAKAPARKTTKKSGGAK